MKQYQIKISNTVGDLYERKDINRAWENIKENIKTSAKESLGLDELKYHKPWFHEGVWQETIFPALKESVVTFLYTKGFYCLVLWLL
jgi:hypothetical protein